MAAATMDRLRQLYGQPRDAYAGTTPPVVATPRDPARLLHYCVAGDGDRDRATLQGAVLALRRQRGVHDAA